MSNVEFKKWPCRHVEYSGPDPSPCRKEGGRRGLTTHVAPGPLLLVLSARASAFPLSLRRVILAGGMEAGGLPESNEIRREYTLA